jgi:mono/diheme cytochrome c family protein
VYGNAAAGEQVRRMLAAGASKPWQDILFEATGERQMDATAMVEYFQPLLKWLERQNQGKPIGWGAAAAAGAGAATAFNPASATRGKAVWGKFGCGGCHGIGKKTAAPDLANVASRRTPEWLRQWMKNTTQMLASDSIAKRLMAESKGAKMPQFKLTDADIEAVLQYIAQESQKLGARP